VVAGGPTPASSVKSRGFLQNLFGGSPVTAQNSTTNNPLTSLSNMVTDTLSPSMRRLSVTSSYAVEDNSKRYDGFTEREAALAETLEIAQERIMELVKEMESTQEANNIVLETKESVLRSLARQNTHLAMEVSGVIAVASSLASILECSFIGALNYKGPTPCIYCALKLFYTV
jgi:hypothetical protein